MGITIENLQVDDLHANPHNPRKQIGDVEELASSIRSRASNSLCWSRRTARRTSTDTSSTVS